MKNLTITSKNFTSQLNGYKNKRDTMQLLLDFAFVESNNGINLQRFQQVIDATKDIKGINSEQIKKYILAHGLRVNNKGNLALNKKVDFARPQALWYDYGRETVEKVEKTKEEWLLSYAQTVLKNLEKHEATQAELEETIKLLQTKLKAVA